MNGFSRILYNQTNLLQPSPRIANRSERKQSQTPFPRAYSSSSFSPFLFWQLSSNHPHTDEHPSPRGGGSSGKSTPRAPNPRSLRRVADSMVFSLFMWRNRIKSVAASRVAGWDYSRTVTGQVTPGIRCNRFFLADFSLPFSLPPRYTSSIQFSDPSGPTPRHDYRGNI